MRGRSECYDITRKFLVIFPAFEIGRAALAGGAALGVGALCYYGLGFSNKPGALEQSV